MIERARYQVKRFATDRFVALQLVITAILHVLIWVYLVLNAGLFSESTFLHYSVGVGVDYVGTSADVFTLPGVGLLIIILNTAYAFTVFNSSKPTAYVFVGLTSLWHVFIAIASLLVVSLNA